MTSFLIYLIQANLVLAVLYLSYKAISLRTTFLVLRRIVLCFIWMVSPVVPLMDFSGLFPSREVDNSVQRVPDLLSSFKMPSADVLRDGLSRINIDNTDYLGYIGVVCLTVAVLMLSRMFLQIFSIVKVWRSSNSILYSDGTPVFLLSGNDACFSFFRWIFIYSASIKDGSAPDIVRHEKVYACQLHSFDVCLSYLLTSVFWFNPFAYLLASETRRNLEYIADRNAIRNGSDRKTYQYNLLKLVCRVNPVGIYNSFNHSHLKERIMMMNRPPSQKKMCWLYLFLPLIAFLFPLLGVFAEVESSVTVLAPRLDESEVLISQELDKNSEAVVFSPVAEKAHTETLQKESEIVETVQSEPLSVSSPAKKVSRKVASSSIAGSWVILSPDSSVITYKLLKEDGRYVNLRSYDKGETYSVMRKGMYELGGDNVYIENLQYEFGSSVTPEYPIFFRYSVKGDELHLSFRMWGREMNEVWKRVSSAFI